jgi:hypothetical protein
MAFTVTHGLRNPLSSASGIASCVAIFATLGTVLIGIHSSFVPNFAKTEMCMDINACIAAVAGVCKLFIGWSQTDAGQQEVKLPDGAVGNVPSHEVPDDPNAVVVDTK